jgi:hypothetical protein
MCGEHAFECSTSRVDFFSTNHTCATLPKAIDPLKRKNKRGKHRPGLPVTINPLFGLGTICHNNHTLDMDIHSVLTIIGSVSPSLAAYHHVKFQQADHRPLFRCSRCGHQLLPGTSRTRIRRSSPTPKFKRKHKGQRSDPIVRSIEQTCATCGHVNNTPLHPINHPHSDNVTTPSPLVVTEGPRTHRTDPCLPPDRTPVPSHHHPPRHSSPPSASPQPQLQARPKKSRPKHKAGLQEMLARNNDRQREAANRSSSGLATFLHTL